MALNFFTALKGPPGTTFGDGLQFLPLGTPNSAESPASHPEPVLAVSSMGLRQEHPGTIYPEDWRAQ
jgi:hypothetical protein